MNRTTGDPFGIKETTTTGGSTVIISTAPYPGADTAEQLRAIPEEAIISYLRERGWLVEWPGVVMFARVGGRDLLPRGYPPRAEEDLPFEVGRDE